MNNLYGGAQMFKLPESDFMLLPEREICNIDWNNIDGNSDYGYIAEVDLLYPPEIHEKTQSFPLCPENVDITYEMLSPINEGA